MSNKFKRIHWNKSRIQKFVPPEGLRIVRFEESDHDNKVVIILEPVIGENNRQGERSGKDTILQD